MLTTFSGVAANFAGVPLAFAFVATLGALGVVTTFMHNQLGIDLYGRGINFSLFTKTGVEIVYLYFQIPLMILVIAPAIDGLRREWREAASSLGASTFQFWRHIGFPILMPSLLGAVVLLFGNSFSAYATAYAPHRRRRQPRPVMIGFYLNGNVLSDPHLGQALAFGMFVVLAAMMLIYAPLQRRSSRWHAMRPRVSRPSAVVWLLLGSRVLPDPAGRDAHLQHAEQRDGQVLHARQLRD